MTRPEILDAAKKCVCGEREQDYGTPENNFETIGLLWGVYLKAAHPQLQKVIGVNGIAPKDVAAMMALLKLARIAAGSSPDSFIDLAGYAACAGEIATQTTGGNQDFAKHVWRNHPGKATGLSELPAQAISVQKCHRRLSYGKRLDRQQGVRSRRSRREKLRAERPGGKRLLRYGAVCGDAVNAG